MYTQKQGSDYETSCAVNREVEKISILDEKIRNVGCYVGSLETEYNASIAVYMLLSQSFQTKIL